MLLLCLFIGFVIYFGYGVRNSSEGYRQRNKDLPVITNYDTATAPEYEDSSRSSSALAFNSSEPVDSETWVRQGINSDEKKPLLYSKE